MDRRTFLTALGTGVVTSSAGCLSTRPEIQTSNGDKQINPKSSELTASEFRTVALDSHEAYRDGGVWGTAESEPTHDRSFQGAWSQTLSHQSGITSEHLLALFRLPSTPDGSSSSQVWLWSGIDPEDAVTVRRIKTGVLLPSGGPSLGVYSPAQDFNADTVSEYVVESGRLDVEALRATMPLSSGQIGVGEETQIGDEGAFFPYWRGQSGSVQTLAGTTEIRWTDPLGSELTWNVSVGIST